MPQFNRRSVFAFGAGAFAAVVGGAPAPVLAQSPGSAEQRLRDKGIVLPKIVPNPAVHIVPYVRTGNLLFLSGRTPGSDPSVKSGKAGKDVSADDAYQLARLTGIGLLAVVQSATGSLDRVTRVVKVLGMVNSAPDFTDQPKVVNGCSDLFIEIFGDERGRHARSAVGVAALGGNAVVEIEAIFEVN